jgi:hypothetical protein
VCAGKLPLQFVSNSSLRWDGNRSSQLSFDPAALGWEARGAGIVTPPNSVWRKNPIARGAWEWPVSGPSFPPLCEESTACRSPQRSRQAREGECRCSGTSTSTLLLPNLEVVDSVRVPTVPPGHYVVQWRWDAERSDQIWLVRPRRRRRPLQCHGTRKRLP